MCGSCGHWWGNAWAMRGQGMGIGVDYAWRWRGRWWGKSLIWWRRSWHIAWGLCGHVGAHMIWVTRWCPYDVGMHRNLLDTAWVQHGNSMDNIRRRALRATGVSEPAWGCGPRRHHHPATTGPTHASPSRRFLLPSLLGGVRHTQGHLCNNNSGGAAKGSPAERRRIKPTSKK